MAPNGSHRAVHVVEHNTLKNPWECCRLAPGQTPSPGPSQVLVRILCSPINPADVLSIQGRYEGWSPEYLPAAPGYEGMGVIAQVGDDVSDIAIGQRVIAFAGNPAQTGQGCWQDYVIFPASQVIPIPDSVSNEAAAQFFGGPGTVVALFRTLDAPKGEYVIQTAAASVLGRMAIQYAHYLGVKTINIVRRNDRIEELKALGADEVINSNDGNIVEKVRQITRGKMAYGALECVGGEMTKVVVESVRNGGTVFVYGLLGASHAEVGISDLIFRDVKVHGFWLSTWLSGVQPNEFQELVGHIISLLAQKVIEPSVGEKYAFDQFKDAIKKSLEPNRGGKVFFVNDK